MVTGRCKCRDGRTLDQLLMDYILFNDLTAADTLVRDADRLRGEIRETPKGSADAADT